MDQCLRMALWMLVLAGCVGGTPVREIHVTRLQDVQCPSNVTFTSLTDVQDSCYAAALSTIKAELNAAKPSCSHTNLISNAVKTLALFTEHAAPTNSSDCSWENQPRKQLKDFVEDLKVIVQKLNSLRVTNAPQ